MQPFTPPGHDDDEAPAHLPPEGYGEGVANFFDLDYNLVSKRERAKNLKQLAQQINRWKLSGTHMGKPAPNSLVLLMPEGYGKSHLVLDLISKGFKVVFCAKSHSQLDEKEFGFRNMHNLQVHRFVSRRQNFRMQLEELGLPANDFKFVEPPATNPYAMPEVNEPETIQALAEFFDSRSIDRDASEFFYEHYGAFEAQNEVDGRHIDVVLVTFAAMQALTTGERIRWWVALGLVERTKPADPETNSPAKKFPFKKIAIIYDDPDRADVDWLRGISADTAEKFQKLNERRAERKDKKESPNYWAAEYPKYAEHLAAAQRDRNEKRQNTPRYKIFEYKNAIYLERPEELRIGAGLKDNFALPTVIVTTTEWLTGYYALQTLKRTQMNPLDHIDLFRSAECTVTAISTTITRKQNHAVLLPIVKKLELEFPKENVTLIANALGCELNLSNNKGRNDLSDKTTIIKLSWPHPSVNATIGAHFADVEKPDYDLMIATELADLGNQALGRNQGFRFKGRQAIILIDPKYHDKIISNKLLRYKLTPWSSKLPQYNKKTTKREALAALQFSADQSPLECRLLTLIKNFESFGLSDEARQVAKLLPERQREYFDTWLAENGSAEAIAEKAAKLAARSVKVAEGVRRHRARAKQS